MRDAHSAELTGRERGRKASLDAFGLLGRRAGRIEPAEPEPPPDLFISKIG